MLINEEHVMLEAGIKMGFESKLHNDRVMVTVNVSINPVETFE